MNIGWGHYDHEDAIGLTAVHRVLIEDWDHLILNVGAAYGFHQDGPPLLRGGFSFMF